MALLYANKVSPQFASKVISKSDKLPIEPDWAMFIMNYESGIDSNRPNFIGCVGLIQFCPDTAGGKTKTIKGIVYTLADIKNMTPERQLDLVFDYWDEIQGDEGRYSTYHDLYLGTFYPYAINQPDDYVIGMEKGSGAIKIIAQQNPSFDANKDLKITKGEFKMYLDEYVRKNVPQEYWGTFFKKKSSGNSIKEKSFGEASLLPA